MECGGVTTASGLQQVVPTTNMSCCDCVDLVSVSHIVTQLTKPHPDLRLSVRIPTLHYLQKGYLNFVVNNASEEVHVLVAYTCRSARLKLYRMHKNVTCKDDRQDKENEKEEVQIIPGTKEELYVLLKTVNRYLHVFSVLCDFNYNHPSPTISGGLCNVLVVDKVWTRSVRRSVFIPEYRLLHKDHYTDYVLSALKALTTKNNIRIRYLRFMSSLNTVLYTNRPALVEKGVHANISPPLQLFAHITKGRTPRWWRDGNEKSEEENGSCNQKDVSDRGRPPRQNMDMPQENDTIIRNPTLIVFKHGIEPNEPDTMVCNIIAEVQLDDKILYD